MISQGLSKSEEAIKNIFENFVRGSKYGKIRFV